MTAEEFILTKIDLYRMEEERATYSLKKYESPDHPVDENKAAIIILRRRQLIAQGALKAFNQILEFLGKNDRNEPFPLC